jgi:hypothetical protein
VGFVGPNELSLGFLWQAGDITACGLFFFLTFEDELSVPPHRPPVAEPLSLWSLFFSLSPSPGYKNKKKRMEATLLPLRPSKIPIPTINYNDDNLTEGELCCRWVLFILSVLFEV